MQIANPPAPHCMIYSTIMKRSQNSYSSFLWWSCFTSTSTPCDSIAGRYETERRRIIIHPILGIVIIFSKAKRISLIALLWINYRALGFVLLMLLTSCLNKANTNQVCFKWGQKQQQYTMKYWRSHPIIARQIESSTAAPLRFSFPAKKKKEQHLSKCM